MKIDYTDNGKMILTENEREPSEMRFGEYDPSDVYVVERHRFGGERDTGVKTVEFILKRDDDIILLEAKPKTSREYFCTASEKIFDSLNKYFSFIAGRNQNVNFTSDNYDNSKTRFCFYLVVRKLDKAYAEQANDTFAKALCDRFSKSYINIWNLDVAKDSLVISYEDAKKINIAC